MSFNWSSDFTTLGGLDITDLTGVFLMFYNAVNERVSANSGTIAFPSSGGDVLSAWRSLHDAICGSGSRPVVNSPHQVDIGTNLSGATVLNQPSEPQPSPQGARRQFPRTIYTLSQSGSSGWRARFEAMVSEQYWGVLVTDPLWGTSVTTPSGERTNSGKIFTYTGGAWVVSGDQISDVDRVSETITSGATGRQGPPMYRGDYFTGQMLNDFRDQLNQFTQFAYTAVGAGAGIGTFGSTGGAKQVAVFPNNAVQISPDQTNPLAQNRSIDWYYFKTSIGTWTSVGTTPPTSATASVQSPTYNVFADNVCAICRWDVTGGFKYVSGYAGI